MDPMSTCVFAIKIDDDLGRRVSLYRTIILLPENELYKSTIWRCISYADLGIFPIWQAMLGFVGKVTFTIHDQLN